MLTCRHHLCGNHAVLPLAAMPAGWKRAWGGFMLLGMHAQEGGMVEERNGGGQPAS